MDDLTIAVEAGQIYGLTGPYGSGKTTTVSLATGVYRPTVGHRLIAWWRVLRPRARA